MRWRDFSGAEILWLVHTSTLENMKQEAPAKVRKYLTDVKDYTALREWDISRMKESKER